jgi:hypothetical protein
MAEGDRAVTCHCSRGGFHRHVVSGLSSRRDGANGRRSRRRAGTRCGVGKQMDGGAGRGEEEGGAAAALREEKGRAEAARGEGGWGRIDLGRRIVGAGPESGWPRGKNEMQKVRWPGPGMGGGCTGWAEGRFTPAEESRNKFLSPLHSF